MKTGTAFFPGLMALNREEPRDAALTHTGGGIWLPDDGARAVHVLTS